MQHFNIQFNRIKVRLYLMIFHFLQLLSQAYRNIKFNTNTAGTSAIAQEANFWDPPSKNESPVLSQDENLQGLLK